LYFLVQEAPPCDLVILTNELVLPGSGGPTL
jgi:hypothetical protein